MSSSPTERPEAAETTLIDVTMPQMGVSVAEGTVVEWRKQPGDWVERDEIICAISTDKIDTDVESPAAGRVEEILVEVGTTVDVGAVLARLATDARPGEPHATENVTEATAALEAPGEPGALQGDTAEIHEESAQQPAGPPRPDGPRRYSPVVQRIAAEHGIDLASVQGTGRGGRVRKQDVLLLVDGQGAQPAAEPPMHIESPYRPEPIPPKASPAPFAPAPEAAPAPAAAPAGGHAAPLSRIRKSIGEHMHRSLQTAATCTTIVEADLSRIEVARARLGLTYLPFVARAAIDSLRTFPALNATFEGDTFTTYDGVHLGIAVSLGEDGLIVPVIHDAQDLSVEGLGGRIRELAAKARGGRLSPDEVRGGTFTITNPGAFGAVLATPVINQPQVAILDSEAVVKRAVVVTDELGQDSIAIRPMTYFCMSWDHRALDGALAARFLSDLRGRLESWPL